MKKPSYYALRLFADGLPHTTIQISDATGATRKNAGRAINYMDSQGLIAVLDYSAKEMTGSNRYRGARYVITRLGWERLKGVPAERVKIAQAEDLTGDAVLRIARASNVPCSVWSMAA